MLMEYLEYTSLYLASVCVYVRARSPHPQPVLFILYFSQSCVMCTLTRLCGHSSFPNVYMNS